MGLHTKYQGSRPLWFLSLCKIRFWPQGHYLNTLDRGILDDAYIPRIKALGLVVPEEKMFSGFPYISLCKIYDPCGVPVFWPQGHYLNTLDRGILDDAYIPSIKALGLVVFENIFIKFSH